MSGAHGKIPLIRDCLITMKYDIIIIQETCLNSNTDDDARKDRACFANTRTKGGGVAIIITNDFPTEEIELDASTVSEMVGCRIFSYPKAIIIINVYMPPYARRQRILSDFIDAIQLITKKYPNDELIIIGDFNFSSISPQHVTKLWFKHCY